jgi:hypothetical protein
MIGVINREGFKYMKKGYWVILLAVCALIGAGVAFAFLANGKQELQLVPKPRAVSESSEFSGTETGTGWSIKADPGEAVQEALAMALKDKKQGNPDFAAIFATSGSDLGGILSETRKLLGDKIKIYGGTSDSRAVMTNKGFIGVGDKDYVISGANRALAVMTVTSKDIVFGVGSADFSLYPQAQEAAKAATLKALQSCGKSPGEVLQVVLATISRGFEEDALEGIAEAVGKNVSVLGGTTGGPKFAVLGDREAYAEGVSLAVIYTKLPLGWVFEAGFDVQNTPGGVVTKVVDRAIVEIDGRPALDVYDEWLGGKIKKLTEEFGDDLKIRTLLNLHPFYRRYTSREGQDYFLFSHPWPKDPSLQDKSLVTSTKINQGDKIHLSHGTWERLLNRIGNLPIKARARGGINPEKKPLFSIGYLCSGVMRVIPEEERQQMPLLINYANNNAPFIATFSWGEQGHFPGIGNKHGNLLTSFLVIAERETK